MKSLHDELWQRIGELALTSMLYEVSTTPKPGLVDRSNCGAHLDMDFFTFMTSASSLRQFLIRPLRRAGRLAQLQEIRFRSCTL